MALVVKDRVRQTSTTAGTGTITLTGSVSGFQAFSVIGDGNTTYYTIVDPTTGDWEVGVGTYTLTGATLSRDTVLESSNAGNLVSFGSAVKDVFCTYPAERSVYTDAAGTAITPATASTLGVASGGTGLSSYTANGIVYASGTTTLASSSGLTFNGTNFATTGSVTSAGASNSGNLTFTGTGNRITGDFSNATVANRVMFQTSTVNGVTQVAAIPNGTTIISNFAAYGNSSATDTQKAQITCFGGADVRLESGIFGTASYIPMTFYTGGSERVRIDTSGNVGIGTSSPSGKLHVSGGRSYFTASAEQYALALKYNAATSGVWLGSPGTDAFTVSTEAGTERMRITSDGEVYIAGTTDQGAYNLQVNGTGVWGAGAYVNGSDARLKENVQTLTDGLAVVTQLRPVTFQYKADYSKDTAVQPGFIAQELQQAMAGKDYVDGVVQAGPEYLNVAYQSLIPVLTKAIQELKAELDTVKAELQTLKGN